MANEKNVTAVATESKVQAAETRFVLERSEFTTKDGRTMWGYAVQSKVRGREVKADFVAYDQGGYEVLDMVFDIKDTADLVMHDETMTDADTGEVRTYTVYEAQNVDEDGDILTCRVKPSKSSDKSTLDYLMRKLAKQAADGKGKEKKQ